MSIKVRQALAVFVPDIPGQLANVTEALACNKILALCSFGTTGVDYRIDLVVEDVTQAISAINSIVLPPGQAPYLVEGPRSVIVVEKCVGSWATISRALADNGVNIDQAYNGLYSTKVIGTSASNLDKAVSVLEGVSECRCYSRDKYYRRCKCKRCRPRRSRYSRRY